jgi:hypothetical protein
VRGEAPVQWSADGGSIYAAQTVGDSVEVTRVELTTGRRSVWKRLPLAGERMERLLITPDARTYVLGRMQARNELYLIDGLH